MIGGNEKEFIEVFLKEMRGYINTLEKNILSLEKQTKDKDKIVEINRVLHSIKGIFGIIGKHYSDARVLTHELEDLFNTKEEVDSETLEILLNYVDDLKKLVNRVESNNSLKIAYNDLFLQVKKKFKPEIVIDQKFELKISFSKDSTMKTARMLALINQLKRISQIEKTEPTTDELLEDIDFESGKIILRTRESRHKIADVISRIPEVESFVIQEIKPDETLITLDKEKTVPWATNKIEVDVGKLEKIISLLEELVVAGTVIEKLDYSDLSSSEIEVLSGFMQNVISIQELVFEIRQVPVQVIVSKIPRLVRDLAKKNGKKAQVFLIGSHIGLDRIYVEALADPLIVLVQNSVIHGLETPEIRKKKDKPEIGTITISVELKEGKTIITVSDDGKGIDLKKVWKKAVEKNLISKQEPFSKEKALELIFYPEISTSKKATTAAGRGMGLYSVKKVVEELEGEVRVFTEKDKGTKFEIILPIKKPIIPILFAQINETIVGFPQSEIEYIQRIHKSNKLELEKIWNKSEFLIEKGDEKIIVINLLYQLITNDTHENHNLDLKQEILENAKQKGLAIIYGRYNDETYGFLINNVLDIKELAVNYDDPITKLIPYIQGSARIMGTETILILNPRKFVEEIKG